LRLTRLSSTHNDRGEIVQVIVAVFEDGEKLAEAFMDVGPFDTVDDAFTRCHQDAVSLADGQLRGQARLWEDGPAV
jgi:hypothetical protein